MNKLLFDFALISLFIRATETGLSVASVVGMVFGVVIVAAIVIYLGVRSYKKRMSRRNEVVNAHMMEVRNR